MQHTGESKHLLRLERSTLVATAPDVALQLLQRRRLPVPVHCPEDVRADRLDGRLIISSRCRGLLFREMSKVRQASGKLRIGCLSLSSLAIDAVLRPQTSNVLSSLAASPGRKKKKKWSDLIT